MRRHERGLALAHRFDRRFGQRFGVDVPLIGEIGLEHGAGTIAVRHDVRRRFDLVDEPVLFQPLDNSLARREAIEAVQGERRGKVGRWRHAIEKRGVVLEVELPFDVEDVDERQLMAAADLEIVEIVRRRDLHRAGAFFRIGIVVADDRNAPADKRQDAQFCRSGD